MHHYQLKCIYYTYSIQYYAILEFSRKAACISLICKLLFSKILKWHTIVCYKYDIINGILRGIHFIKSL